MLNFQIGSRSNEEYRGEKNWENLETPEENPENSENPENRIFANCLAMYCEAMMNCSPLKRSASVILSFAARAAAAFSVEMNSLSISSNSSSSHGTSESAYACSSGSAMPCEECRNRSSVSCQGLRDIPKMQLLKREKIKIWMAKTIVRTMRMTVQFWSN